MKKQSLKQALYLIETGESESLSRAACYLDGCPVGGWGETTQARRQIVDELPHRELRSYTVSEFIAAVYTVDDTDRYRINVKASPDRQAEAQR